MVSLYSVYHFVPAGVYDAACHKDAALLQKGGHAGHQRFDGAGHDVGADDVVLPAGLIGQIANENFEILLHPVALRIFACGAHAHGVDIYTLGLGCAQFQRRDGQNAAACADIQHAFAAPHTLVQRF